jgi:hypothetical protein
LLETGFYSSDELIDLALRGGFTVTDPLMRVRRGTVIGKGVGLLDGSAVEGRSVTLAEGAVLDRAVISGSDIVIGPGTRVIGTFALDRVTVGTGNVIEGLSGSNRGTIRIGANNSLRGVTFQNGDGNAITLGDENKLYPGLSVNAPFPGGSVRIGHRNELGRDGGGVVSSSYRFDKGWGGPVLIGSFVETTRGAEVLGYSLLGYPTPLIESMCGLSEAALAAAFVAGDLGALDQVFDRVARDFPTTELVGRAVGRVSLFGTVKAKRCCVCPNTSARDDTRLLCAYVRDSKIAERCNIFYSSLRPFPGSMLSVSSQDVSIVQMELTEGRDWDAFPRSANVDNYPRADEVYYAQEKSRHHV